MKPPFNEDFITPSGKELSESGRIKETRTPFVYKDRIKLDEWRTMQNFVDNKGFSV